MAEAGGPECGRQGRVTRRARHDWSRRRFSRRRHHINRQPHRRIDRQRRGAESGDARSEVHAERGRIHLADVKDETLRTLRGERRIIDVQRVGVELDQETFVVLGHRARGARCRVDRQACARRDEIVADRHARHAEVADDQQVRRLAKVELRVINQRQRPIDELHRHEPASAGARSGRRQRHEPARHRRQRLVGEHDRLVFVSDRERAERVFAHGQLERGGQIVDRDEFLIVDERERQRAPAVLRENREGDGRRGLAGDPDELDSSRGRAGTEGPESEIELSTLPRVQWRISGSRDPPFYRKRVSR